LISGQERADGIKVLRAGVIVFGHGRRVVGVGLGGRVELGLDLGLLVVAQAGNGRRDGLQRRRSLHAAAETSGTSVGATATTAAATSTRTGSTRTGSTRARLGEEIGGSETEGDDADGREGFHG
jgi:hypothetical protein